MFVLISILMILNLEVLGLMMHLGLRCKAFQLLLHISYSVNTVLLLGANSVSENCNSTSRHHNIISSPERILWLQFPNYNQSHVSLNLIWQCY